MASNFNDPTSWRLRTPGGIPYKFVSMSGAFEEEKGSISTKLLIQSTNLLSFLQEIFPRPTRIGNMIIPVAQTLPGFPSLAVQRVQMKSLDDGLPIDPFSFDPVVAAGTYYPVLQLDIGYDSSVQKKDTSSGNPLSFLEITGNTTGEFITTPSPGASWQERTNTLRESASSIGDWVDLETGDLLSSEESFSEPEEDPAGNFPLTILVPHTEWTIRWGQIPYDYYQEIMHKRLQILLGRVNKKTVPILFDAAPGTLLFMGFTYQHQHTWRPDSVTNPSVEIEMKVLEKRVVWEGLIQGHNEFWRPGHGWQTLLHDGNKKVYQEFDYNLLTAVGGVINDSNDGTV